jgi:hypothetical protein
MRFAALVIAMFVIALPAMAQPADDEAKVRDVIAQWYERVGSDQADAPWVLMAPGSIDGGPGYSLIPRERPDQQSAAGYSGPRLNNELAAKALKFSYDIDVLKIDSNFAKALVWERGYFYAWAAQQTHENAASTLFILEKQDDGRWLILAHDARSTGIPPTKITDPMPDLHDLYYSTEGAGRDPEADAKAAKGF